MNSFEINKIITAILVTVLLVFGIGKISDVIFDKDDKNIVAYKVEAPEDTAVQTSAETSVDITALLGRGQPLYMLLYISAIAFFAFFYTSVVFNAQDTADNLKNNGGFVPGIRPGESTANYIDYVLTRLTVIGSAYLCAVCILPELLISQYSVPFYLGGTSLLIVVTVTMDTVAQVHSHLIAHQYEGLIKKAKLRGRF